MLHVLRSKAGLAIRKAYRARGVDLIRQPDLADFLASRNCDLVIDVGANVGQFGLMLREQGYRGAILSFEPSAKDFAELEAVADWEVRRVALGAEPGVAGLNVSESSDFSSIKPLAKGAAERFSYAQVDHVEQVRVRRLDDQLQGRAERPFLKIDTQGFEQEVLAGATVTLARCVGVLMEVPVRNLYEGTWAFAEAIAFMDRNGFAPAQIRPVCQDPLDPASALEFDVLFARKEA